MYLMSALQLLQILLIKFFNNFPNWKLVNTVLYNKFTFMVWVRVPIRNSSLYDNLILLALVQVLYILRILLTQGMHSIATVFFACNISYVVSKKIVNVFDTCRF